MSGSGTDHIDDKNRYNRYAEDWRFHHRLIWEIPGVTSAIFGGIVVASFSLLGFLPRIFLLSVGMVLMLVLTLAVRKHRFGADLRTNFLEEISCDKMKFPIRSEEGLKYLRARNQRKRRRDGWLITTRSEVWLIRFMFLAFLALMGLVILTSIQIFDISVSLSLKDKSISEILDTLIVAKNSTAAMG